MDLDSVCHMLVHAFLITQTYNWTQHVQGTTPNAHPMCRALWIRSQCCSQCRLTSIPRPQSPAAERSTDSHRSLDIHLSLSELVFAFACFFCVSVVLNETNDSRTLLLLLCRTGQFQLYRRPWRTSRNGFFYVHSHMASCVTYCNIDHQHHEQDGSLWSHHIPVATPCDSKKYSKRGWHHCHFSVSQYSHAWCSSILGLEK